MINMKLNVQKKLAAQILKCSEKKIKLDTDRLDEIKESITKQDIRGLIQDKAIVKKHEQGSSRVRARLINAQKVKGKRRGQGSRKGKFHAREPRKDIWMATIRKQRGFIKELRERSLLTTEGFKTLYKKAKGGFFRSVRHIKLYMQENDMITRGKK